MKEILNEKWLCHMIDTARDTRIKQLNAELTAWEEYAKLVSAKEFIFKNLEEEIQRNGKEFLSQYDDACGMLVAKAGDYFYERGFADCLRLLGGMLEKVMLE